MLEKILKKLAPLALAAGMALGISGNSFTQPVEKEIKPVVMGVDDFQINWFDNVQDYIVQEHSKNDIPITLGVIPKGIEDDSPDGIAFSDNIKKWNKNPKIEVAQHDYDHFIGLEGICLEGQDYNFQYDHIRKGKNLLNGIEVYPKSFVPAFGAADETTVKVGRDLGFDTLYAFYGYLASSEKPIVLVNALSIWENNGVGENAVLKSYDVLKSDIESKLKEDKVALIVYHVQDFGRINSKEINKEKMREVIDHATNLKKDGYTLMTVKQYHSFLHR